MGLVQCGAWRLEVDDALLEQATARCKLEPFLLRADGLPSALFLERVDRLPDEVKRPLEGSPAPWGYYAVQRDRVRAWIPDEPFAAEAALRAAFQIGVLRQGGVLLHASAVRVGQRAALAVGPSGAGKSTFARQCVEAGAELLSDEINALYPDGRCHGSPFKSDLELPGSPDGGRVASVLVLEKGPQELFTPLPVHEVLPLVMAQTFRPVAGELSSVEATRRVTQALEAVGAQRLTFRKHPDAGQFLVDWLR